MSQGTKSTGINKEQIINNIKELMTRQERIHSLTSCKELLHELDMLVISSIESLCYNQIQLGIEQVLLDFYMKNIIRKGHLILSIDDKQSTIKNIDELIKILKDNQLFWE